MQEQGYLTRVPAKRMSTVEDMWFLAPFAARLALEPGETLDPEDFPEPREELPNCVWRGAATPFADNH
jgi:hypothetical protein